MSTELPARLLAKTRFLTPENLENNLLKQEDEIFLAGSWNLSKITSGLFFDLSSVEWVNIGAAVRLAVLIESALKMKIRVLVALPFCKPGASEKFEDKIARAKRRNAANIFLKTIQFDSAVQCAHIYQETEILLSESFDFSKPYNNISLINEFTKSKVHSVDFSENNIRFNYNFIVPISWIDASSDVEIESSLDNLFTKVLTNEERGLDSIDLKSIKNVILSELIKNVEEHTNCNKALIAIGLLPVRTLVANRESNSKIYSNKIEEKYVKWVDQNGINNLIEIYFGDSGGGLISHDLQRSYRRKSSTDYIHKSKSEDLEILKWSFDKWSSRKINEEIRGTKGLYRINRIVNKYNGIFLIRTQKLYGGYQKGGYSSSHWVDNENKKLSSFPGTLIELKLCPYSEIKEFTFKFKKSGNRRKWKTAQFIVKDKHTDLFKKLIDGLNNSSSTYNLIIIFKSEKNLSFTDFKEFLSASLQYLSYIRHPNGIVVYILDEIGKDLQDIIADSANELRQKMDGHTLGQEVSNPHNEIVYDPILILGNDTISWFGGDQKIIEILNEAYLDGREATNLLKLSSFNRLIPADRTMILFHFQNDDSLVTVSDKFDLEFNFTHIGDLFRKKLSSFLSGISPSENLTCTPTLKPVTKWYDVKDILRNGDRVGYALAMYLMMKEQFSSWKPSKVTRILIDHSYIYELAAEFSKIYGIGPHNIVNINDDIDYDIPRRSRLFNAGDEVIILTSIISSSETIRRLDKYAKRDLANVLCIICLANFRERNVDNLTTWGSSTPILSIYKKHKVDQISINISSSFIDSYKRNADTLAKCKNFIQPDYNIKGENSIFIESNEPLKTEVKEFLIRTKSLHYNHYGKFNGRHFTFALDQKKILETPSFVWSRFTSIIADWQGDRFDHFSIVKSGEKRGNAQFFNALIRHLRNRFRVEAVVNALPDTNINASSKNVVFIDFGALTGESINKLFTTIRDVDNVLVCILFSQFKNNEQLFYERIRTIGVPITLGPFEGKQFNLFDNNPLNYKTGEAQTQITFLFNFPLKFYTSAICPICEQDRALSLYPVQNKYASDYAQDRKRRIRIKDRIDMPQFPCDFYLGSTDEDNNFELSSRLIMLMYELSVLIENATIDTSSRVKLYWYLVDVRSNMAEFSMDPDSKLYALLYLFSNEVHLLQRQPLVFRDLRNMVADMATYICTVPADRLVEDFYDPDASHTNPLRLCVRFKFAAITVLRASNKYKFCELLADIVKASRYDNRIRDNLLQNIFFHVQTLHENQYNRSTDYFSLLQHQFNQIDRTLFSTNQKAAYFSLRTQNQLVRRSLEWDRNNTISPKNVIKSLKQEFFALYNLDSHPPHYESFVSLDFRNLDSHAFPDFILNRESSPFYRIFNQKISYLLDRWDHVNHVIKPIVKLYLDKIEPLMFESQIFQRYSISEKVISIFGSKKSRRIAQEFFLLVNEISINPISLIDKYQEYHDYYDDMYEAIISYKKAQFNQTTSSLLLRFLDNFPCDVYEACSMIFGSVGFGSVSIEIDKRDRMVFYPKEVLNYYLDHIRQNILKRKNPGVVESHIHIRITGNRDQEENEASVNLKIEYNGTDMCTDERKLDGGLSQFERDLQIFSGTLDHGSRNRLYQLNITMLSYE
ncbi:hypothetical protein [Dyadobacter arcticus]|uniref:Uncharacterized protein n=1 Tax=Dyadobacter arcticus TaxID=1078754 RepID=A0ABX0UR09_9BACT|nr:hypothetical protein [Dyadobacter arcticus]NIJ55429.1 hypothetical protein [Dyadobacter arcticus]